MIVIALGIIGMMLLVLAYIPMLFGKLSPDSYKFLFGNWFGAFFLMFNGFLSGYLLVYPLLNIVWVIGTTIQIYREWRTRNFNRKT